jgi:5-methylcytosine-specific restriction endonuclease McrA
VCEVCKKETNKLVKGMCNSCYNKTKRDECKSKGICIVCMKRKARKNRTTCEICYKKIKKWQKSGKAKKYRKGYYLKNKERVLQSTKKWRKSENGMQYLKYYNASSSKKRRIRESNIIHDFSYRDWKEKVENTKGFCDRCGRYVGVKNLTMDHIIPISKAPYGTIYTINDVQPLCRSCNSSKNDDIDYSMLKNVDINITLINQNKKQQKGYWLKKARKLLYDVNNFEF